MTALDKTPSNGSSPHDRGTPCYAKPGFRLVRTLTPALQAMVGQQATWRLDPRQRVVVCRSLLDHRDHAAAS